MNGPPSGAHFWPRTTSWRQFALGPIRVGPKTIMSVGRPPRDARPPDWLAEDEERLSLGPVERRRQSVFGKLQDRMLLQLAGW